MCCYIAFLYFQLSCNCLFVFLFRKLLHKVYFASYSGGAKSAASSLLSCSDIAFPSWRVSQTVRAAKTVDNLLRLHFCRSYFQSWHRFPCTKVSRGWWQIDLCMSFSFSSSVNVKHSIDFEIESQIDLGINPKLCKYLVLYVYSGTDFCWH